MTCFPFWRAVAATFALAAMIIGCTPGTATAQQISACYTNKNGTMYRVGTKNTPATCTSASHTLETWGGKLDANGALNLTNANGLVAGGELYEGTIPASGTGSRMMWYPGRAAFRAGYATDSEWDAPNVGPHSFAAGIATTASGYGSAAVGSSSSATASNAFVAGDRNTSAGNASFAMGTNSAATGPASIAVGDHSTASGYQSVALGYYNVAAGHGSVVLGSYGAATSAAWGSFVFGDRSSTNIFTNSTPNSFLVRAAGGVTFTVANGATCSIPSGGGQWACSSSRLLKTGFADLDGEEVLTKIRSLPVQSWSYKAEGDVRHIGPMSQDFRAAFGLGSDDTTIGVLDAAGVSLAGVKALETRTLQLQAENAALRSTVDELAKRVAALWGMRSSRP
jgi:hypothetical protein